MIFGEDGLISEGSSLQLLSESIIRYFVLIKDTCEFLFSQIKQNDGDIYNGYDNDHALKNSNNKNHGDSNDNNNSNKNIDLARIRCPLQYSVHRRQLRLSCRLVNTMAFKTNEGLSR